MIVYLMMLKDKSYMTEYPVKVFRNEIKASLLCNLLNKAIKENNIEELTKLDPDTGYELGEEYDMEYWIEEIEFEDE
jgi:hypothetical protein